MPTINPDLPDDGDAAVVAAYNVVIQAILALVNGGLDSDNLAANAVIASKINALAVTAAKLATDAVETEKIKARNVTGAKIALGGVIPENMGFVGCKAYLSTDQLNLVDDTYTLVNLDTETYDVGANFDTTTHLFTAPAAGYYRVYIVVEYKNGTVVADKRFVARATKNTSDVLFYANGHSAMTNSLQINNSDVVHLDADDTVKLECKASIGANTCDILSGALSTHITIEQISVDVA